VRYINSVLLMAILGPVLYFLEVREIRNEQELFRKLNSTAQDAIIIYERAAATARAQTLRRAALGILDSMPAEALVEQYQATAG
jgi:hypothetical protein